MKTKALLQCSLTASLALAGLGLAPLSFANEQTVDNPPVISPVDEGGIAETPPVASPPAEDVADVGGVDIGTPPETVEEGTVTAEVPVDDGVTVPVEVTTALPEDASYRSLDGDVAPLSYNMAPAVPEASIEAANAAFAATTADAVSAQDAAPVEPTAAPKVVEARLEDKQLGTGSGPVIRDGHLIAR